MRLAWGEQMRLGREKHPGLYWVVPGSSALCPPTGGPATVTLSTHISLESSTGASGYRGEPRFCLTVKHYLYQIIKLVRYATRLEGSEGKDSCIHLPWRGSHGNYTMNTLFIAHAKSPPHRHSPVSLDNRDEFWEVRPQDVSWWEYHGQIWTVQMSVQLELLVKSQDTVLPHMYQTITDGAWQTIRVKILTTLFTLYAKITLR